MFKAVVQVGGSRLRVCLGTSEKGVMTHESQRIMHDADS